MKKEIKDYLHYYIGCEVLGQLNGEKRKGYLTGVTNGGTECEIQFFEEDGINVFEEPEFNTSEEVKVCLRPLSDMTEHERSESFDAWNKPLLDKTDERNIPKKRQAQEVKHLLSKHFDLFGLIDAGLAIDKSIHKL